MHNRRVYITDGVQDKASFVHARMGNHQMGGIDHQIIKEYDIQIQYPGAESDGLAFAPDLGLNGPGFAQKFEGCQMGLNQQGGIDKPILIQVIHRLGAVKGRTRKQFNLAVGTQGIEAPTTVLQRVAEV